MVKPPKLTMAQVYTLRRLASGTSYSLQGNHRKGIENRPDIAVRRGQWFRTTTPINAPSLPVLFRLGLIKFSVTFTAKSPCYLTKYYRVCLTDARLDTLKLTKDRKE